MAKLELYGTAGCPYTQDMREWLEWNNSEFVEYDVETDSEARRRMSTVAPGHRSRSFFKTEITSLDGKYATPRTAACRCRRPE